MPAAASVADHDPKTRQPYTILGPDCAEATSGRPPSASPLAPRNPSSPEGLRRTGRAEDVAPLGPRNRSERRRAARLERGLEKAPARPAQPAPVPEQGAAKPRKTARNVEERYLEQWCAERGPLFESARVAVCRALALGAASRVLKGAGEWGLKERASRVLGEALRPVAPSNNAASGEQWARARKMLTQVRTLVAEGADAGQFVAALVRYFERDHRAQHPEADAGDAYLEHYAWANLVAALYFAPEGALRLRAARTLLAWTRDDARKVGRERRRPVAPEVVELLEELRDVVAGLRECLPLPLGEGARRAGEGCVVAARVRANAPPKPSLPNSPRLRRTSRSPSPGGRGENCMRGIPAPFVLRPPGDESGRGAAGRARGDPLSQRERAKRGASRAWEREKSWYLWISPSPQPSPAGRGEELHARHPSPVRPEPVEGRTGRLIRPSTGSGRTDFVRVHGSENHENEKSPPEESGGAANHANGQNAPRPESARRAPLHERRIGHDCRQGAPAREGERWT